MHRTALLAATVSCFALASVAQAAEAASDKYEVQEVVVTAQKRSERLEDVPLTVVAVSADQLSKSGIGNLQELGKAVPGLRMTSFGFYAVPAIRGVAGSGVGASSEVSTAIFLDGVYLQSRTGMMFDLPDVSQIEVLKGPQSTLSGRSAIGGSILITTLDPTRTPSGLLRVEAGGYDGGGGSGNVRGFVSGPLADNLTASLAGGYSRNWGYVRNVAKKNELTAGSWSEFVRAKVRYQPSDRLDILASAFYSKDSNPSSILFTPLNCGTTAGFASCTVSGKWHANVDYIGELRNKMHGATLRVKYDLGEGVLTSSSGYLKSRSDGNVESDSTPGVFTLSEVHIPTSTWSQEFTFASRQHERFSYLLGASALRVRETVDPFGSHLPFSTVRTVQVYDQNTTTSFAAYGELTYNLTDKLVLVGGARVIKERKKLMGAPTGGPSIYPRGPYTRVLGDHTYNYVAPRASARYKLTDSSNLYATFSTGFKTSGYQMSNYAGLIVNPEKLQAYEVGYKVAEGRYSLNLSAYAYRFKDYQTLVSNRDPVTGVAINILQNAARAKMAGVDLDGSFYVTPDLLISAGVSWQPTAKFGPFAQAVVNIPNPNGRGVLGGVTKDLTGSKLPLAPEFTTSLQAQYTSHLSAGELTYVASLYHTSRFFFDLAHALPQSAYTTLGGQVSFRPAGTQLKATLWVKNLTNKAYYNSFYNSGVLAYSWAQPRQYGLTLEHKF